MKGSLLAALSLSVLLFSCKKHDATTPPVPSGSGPKVPVSFSVADFLQRVDALPSPNGRKAGIATGARDSALATKVSHIYYLAFANGVRVSYLHQDTIAGTDFGLIKDSLPAGNYTIVLAAAGGQLNTYNTDQPYGAGFQSYFDPNFYLIPLPDIFYTKFDITVNGSGNSSSTDVTLDRIMGRLEVNILDAPAIGASDISVEVNPEDFNFGFYDGVLLRGPADFYTLPLTRINQYTFSNLILNTMTDFEVRIKFINKNTGLEQTQIISNIRCYRNKKTTLSGYLYGNPSPTGSNNEFGIGLNDTWDTNGPAINF
jgi:hypothetical protein